MTPTPTRSRRSQQVNAAGRRGEHGRGPALHALWLAASLVAYTYVLRLAYELVVSPTFSYMGEQYRAPDLVNYAFSLGGLYLVGLMLPQLVKTAADVMIWIMYFIMIVPLMMVPHYTELCTPDQANVITAVSGVSFIAMVLLIRGIPTDVSPIIPVEPQLYWLAIATFSLSTYAYMGLNAGFTMASLDLTQVYSIRDSYRDTIASQGALLGYLVRLQGNVINPLLITRGATGGSRWLITAGFVGQFLIYSITGFKTTILSGIGILVVIAGIRVVRHLSGLHVGAGIIGFVSLSLAADLVRGTSLWTALFIDRFILVSGNLAAAHWAVFDQNPVIGWRDSFLSFLGPSPYLSTAGFTVGKHMTGNAAVQANANYVADGFANLHLTGVFIEAAVCAVVVAGVASAGRRLPLTVTAGVLFTPVIALVNSSPITAIITNGFLLAAILFATAPRSMWADAPTESSSRSGRR